MKAPLEMVIPKPLQFYYRNWKGEHGLRRVRANTVYIFYGTTDWHKEEQWIMNAFDEDKQAIRGFAMKDIIGFV
jgi:predicted DNA-binding transcriptional regulator YafY